MRITLATETFFPQVNGVSRTLGELVRVLEQAGDEIQVVHPDYDAPRRGGRDVAVKSLNLPFYRELHLPMPPFGRVGKAIDEFRPDLIHVATEATLGLSVLAHARRRRIPAVSSFHTNFDQYARHYHVGWIRGIVCAYLREFHNRTLETYVPSRATIGELESLGFKRLRLWPRGVDSELFRPERPGRSRLREALGIEPDRLVVGHVGRIAAEKNVGYLSLALARTARERPEVRLLIVGDGPERPTLEKRLGGSAIFVGYRSGEDLADHYAACDLFAFASKTETFGNVVLEALSTGLPVVAVRAGGPADVVRQNETGMLVEPGDPPERFADRLIELIDDAERRRRLADRARSFALSQTWDSVHGALRRRYAEIVRPPIRELVNA